MAGHKSRRENRLTDMYANDQRLVGLTAKVVSDAPPNYRGHRGRIEDIQGKRVLLSFTGMLNDITIHLRGLVIYTMNQEQPTIRFK